MEPTKVSKASRAAVAAMLAAGLSLQPATQALALESRELEQPHVPEGDEAAGAPTAAVPLAQAQNAEGGGATAAAASADEAADETADAAAMADDAGYGDAAGQVEPASAAENEVTDVDGPCIPEDAAANVALPVSEDAVIDESATQEEPGEPAEAPELATPSSLGDGHGTAIVDAAEAVEALPANEDVKDEPAPEAAVEAATAAEPEMVAQAAYQKLSLNFGKWTFGDFAQGAEQSDCIDIVEEGILAGTAVDRDDVRIEVAIDPDSGITAWVDGTTVRIKGPATLAGNYDVVVTATSKSDPTDTATGSMPVKVLLTKTADVYEAGSHYEGSLARSISYADGKSTIWVTSTMPEGSTATVVIPASVTTLAGVTSSYDWYAYKSTYAPKMQQVGFMADVQIQFAAGSQAQVSDIDFYRASYKSNAVGATVTVRKGANVVFRNCAFSNTPVVEDGATATFINCTFLTGEVDAQGSYTVTGGDQPENIADPVARYVPLAVDGTEQGGIGGLFFDSLQVGEQHEDFIALPITGTAAETCQVSAAIAEAGSGLAASYDVQRRGVVLAGTPEKAGIYTVQVTLSATNEDTGEPDVLVVTTQVRVYEQLQVRLRGNLQAVTVGGYLNYPSMTGQSTGVADVAQGGGLMAAASAEDDQPLLYAQATGGGSSSSGGAISGSDAGGDTLVIELREGDGEWMDIDAYNRAAIDNSGLQLPYDGIDIEIVRADGQDLDCGMSMTLSPLGGVLTLSGTAKNPGVYNVYAHVDDGVRKATSNAAELRVYEANLSFKDAFEDQVDPSDPTKFDWDMEPYTLSTTGNAEIGPTAVMSETQALHINGSHEAGVYGIIGNNEYADSETLVIKQGANVTFHNMKFYSSVRIIVEEGATLTLDKSVVYGQLEVHGMLSAPNGSTVTDRVWLMDGSTLKDAKLASHARYLTDGNYDKAEPDVSFIANGDVTIEGDVTLEADGGASDKMGQVGLYVAEGVNVTVAAGANLNVTGGTTDYIYDTDGGSGIVLGDGASITGAGSVMAVGGDSYQGTAGSGIAGNGSVDVGSLTARGGNSAPEGFPTITQRLGQAGNGVDAGVALLSGVVGAAGGIGANAGVDVEVSAPRMLAATLQHEDGKLVVAWDVQAASDAVRIGVESYEVTLYRDGEAVDTANLVTNASGLMLAASAEVASACSVAFDDEEEGTYYAVVSAANTAGADEIATNEVELKAAQDEPSDEPADDPLDEPSDEPADNPAGDDAGGNGSNPSSSGENVAQSDADVDVDDDPAAPAVADAPASESVAPQSTGDVASEGGAESAADKPDTVIAPASDAASGKAIASSDAASGKVIPKMADPLHPVTTVFAAIAAAVTALFARRRTRE